MSNYPISKRKCQNMCQGIFNDKKRETRGHILLVLRKKKINGLHMSTSGLTSNSMNANSSVLGAQNSLPYCNSHMMTSSPTSELVPSTPQCTQNVNIQNQAPEYLTSYLGSNLYKNAVPGTQCCPPYYASLINAVIKTFEDSRNQSKIYMTIWETIVTFAQQHNIELEVPNKISKRKRTEPEFLKNFVVTTTTAAEHEDSNNETNLIDYWKVHAYYPIIDEVVNNLKTRFSAESLNLAISIDHFFNLDYEKSSFFIQQYKDLLKVDLNSLQAEMMVAKNCIQNYNNKPEPGPEQKNQINLFKKNITISTFPNVYKLLNLALTLPISSASCERSFSTMRRINTYIRSTMTLDRFSSLAILNIERDISNNIDSNDILNIYSKTNRRLEL
ncbi:uncharacterized protein LOC132926049 [Rhopalosiphum padi]|uniref:uncharacterized protein LOC132926049 n=1 Tax=Rhopalosiphum padi TaxID=40932 RepID=UPI00298D9EE7|nr:uncharacterized protein LOC132926049 [Rhopalosiphum padi]